MAITTEPFYIRYYSGHQGRHGHEFLEFDFRVLSDGKSASARYANNSNYRNDSLIRKEMCVSSLLVDEIKRIIKASEIMKEDDSKWPQKNKDGRQELEIRLGSEHISFETAKIGSLVDVTESQDPEGLRVFYYLVQDLKALGFSVVHQTLIFTMEEQNFRKSPQITQVKLMPYVTGCAHLSWNQSLSSCFGNAIPGLAVIGTGNRQAEPSTLFNFSQIKLRYFLDIIKRVATVPVLIHIQKAPSKWRAHTSKAIVDSALFLVLPLLLIRSVPRIFKPSLT